MRRGWLVAVLLLAALVPAPAASAHICSLPATFEVDHNVVLNIVVAAEDKPIHNFDISVPHGFTLTSAVGYLGFTATRRDGWVHFQGGEIPIYDCQSVTFYGRPTRTGTLVAHIVTTADDGTRTHYDDTRAGSQFPAQVIYVSSGRAGARSHPQTGAIRIALQVVAVLAIGVALMTILRRRRSPSSSGPDLR